MSNRPLKIISLPVDDGGCGWYRIRQPFQMIKDNTTSDVHIINKDSDDMLQVAKAMHVADLFVVRPGAENGLKMLLEKPEFKGKKWALDIDDNIELISPYSNHYEEYGLDDYYDAHIEKWLWKDGERGFDISKNRQKIADHIQGLRDANLVTVTTKALANYVKQYNKNVAILPNCIDFSRWWKMDLKPNKQLRVVWSGGSSHYEDWFSVKEPLNDLMRKYQFKVIMSGHSFPGVIDDDNRHLLEIHDWVPVKGHSYRMMSLRADISVIPLADLPFNYYKSSIKWYEMSAMGIPSVVSDILPYSEDIKDGVNALGYRSKKQFHEKLEALILNEQLREKLGNKAMEWVKENRDAAKCASLWTKSYSKIIKN